MNNIFTKYYGEYSLKYWIRLLLKKDLILPEFQRPFVWGREKVENFINSLKNNQFIPPVIIGNYLDYNKSDNYILDGQQRLCSLLFSYMGLFPNVKEFVIKYGSGIESSEEDDNDDEKEVIDASRVLTHIQSIYEVVNEKNRDSLISKIKNEKKFLNKDFIKFEQSDDFDSFFNDKYIPFIYIKPLHDSVNDEFIKQEKEYYANLFYNINAKATPLSTKESREAMLWFLGGEVRDLLRVDLTISIATKKEKKDIQYYLAILMYIYNIMEDKIEKIDTAVSELFKNKSSKLGKEQFVLDFIDNITNNDKTNIFGNFNTIFKDLKQTKVILEQCIKDLSDINFDNIAEFEIRFFGLVYWKLFFNKQIDISNYDKKINSIMSTLYNDSDSTKSKDNYVKSINTLKRIRSRVRESIRVFSVLIED